MGFGSFINRLSSGISLATQFFGTKQNTTNNTSVSLTGGKAQSSVGHNPQFSDQQIKASVNGIVRNFQQGQQRQPVPQPRPTPQQERKPEKKPDAIITGRPLILGPEKKPTAPPQQARPTAPAQQPQQGQPSQTAPTRESRQTRPAQTTPTRQQQQARPAQTAPAERVQPQNTNPPAANQDGEVRRVAYAITSVFEGGRPGSLQTVDSGIISYGKHQATLASGSLGDVLRSYTEKSSTETARSISSYMDRVDRRDATLRNDKPFLQLLRNAATDSVMSEVQDAVFGERYWNPAVTAAEGAGVTSNLAKAIYYDTHVQGGMTTVSERTQAKFKGQTPTETEFLKTFLEVRQERLLNIAAAKRKKGDAVTAKMLENTADYRINSLMSLVDANNLTLEGTFTIRGTSISGVPNEQ